MPRLVNVVSALLILVLSIALWTSRRDGVELSAALAQSTEAFIAGSRLPAIPLQSAKGAVRLDSLCDGRRPMLVYFHRRDCPACARLDQVWTQLVGSSDVALHQVHLDGLPSEFTASAGEVSHWTAAPLSVIRQGRVQTVPALLAVGSDCEVKAGGAGLLSATLVMRRYIERSNR